MLQLPVVGMLGWSRLNPGPKLRRAGWCVGGAA